jgi:hypothetical protein
MSELFIINTKDNYHKIIKNIFLLKINWIFYQKSISLYFDVHCYQNNKTKLTRHGRTEKIVSFEYG